MKTTIELLRNEIEARGLDELDASRVFNLVEPVCVYCCMQAPGGCNAPDKGPPPPKLQA
jgi:hypothetical protein